MQHGKLPDQTFTWKAALLSVLAFAASGASAQPLRAKPTPWLGDAKERAVACIIGPASLTPLIVTLPAPVNEPPAPDDEEDEEEDEEEEDAPEFDLEGPVGGIKLPGGQTCIGLSGAVLGGFQIRNEHLSGVNRLATRAQNRFEFNGGMSFRLLTSQVIGNGERVDTNLSLFILPSTNSDSPDIQLTKGYVAFAGWTLGYDSSRFNFWTGAGFLFGARVPARSVLMATRQFQITQAWSTSFGVEDPRSIASQSLIGNLGGNTGRTVPDLVWRAGYETDTLSLHGAVAGTQNPAATTQASASWGVAAIAGATLTFDMLGGTHRLTGQAALARDAPVYLGTQLDLGSISRLIAADDDTRGRSTLLVFSRDWSDTITTNAYVSRLNIKLPKLRDGGGSVDLTRGAANIVWTPNINFRIGVEASLSQSKLELGSRSTSPSSRQSSLALWMVSRF